MEISDDTSVEMGRLVLPIAEPSDTDGAWKIKMKISSVKYMRDFYPAEMRLREWIEGNWREASERAGFEPWDAPIVEKLDLYKRKSGDEIVGQLYTITTRGGEELAIRPEMTPSLARMVSARQAALPRPIKWYCIARMCRYERGQRGRLREFWQWNIDLLGVPGPIADAEVISVALDGLAACGLTADDIEVRINSRSLMGELLLALGVPTNRHAAVYAVTDKRGKVPPEDLEKMYRELGFDAVTLERLLSILACETLDEVEERSRALGVSGHEEQHAQLAELFECLAALGKKDYARFDIGIVRGLAYYTGPVFEIYDRGAKLRALCGGGRYDHLLETMGGQTMPAVGFGLGDVVLGELLAEKGRLPSIRSGEHFHVIPLEEARTTDAMRIAQRVRSRGMRADYAMKAGSLGKAMKRASEAGASTVVFVGGNEWQAGKIRLKDMRSGEEREVLLESFPET